MAEILLFHHAAGLTPGVLDFADTLRSSGHTVHTPDLYEGNVFESLSDGLGYARQAGFGEIQERGVRAAEGLPEGLVYAGFSLGVMAAQRLAQHRPGAKGALLFESFVPPAEFGAPWPDGLPTQIHGMEQDEFFAGDGDLAAAQAFVATTPSAELFVYPGKAHLFVDKSLPTYDESAATLLTERVLAFLARI
jgi:dienelactone hydrolase